ncbi:hypothetical protein LEP1GSC016_1126 [Leptospira borgpetersenii serovar Hardjo-bovis str. Sponselee]|uniref:Uncharacterized protein n=1 Tax=Leptospira borgpetersenii serovar Hardjo-bovis str. Sponselee TaxID=1303729 RepID=M6BU32_LEPBO|nr:hypothetical protein LEP1GSC016_1126 [Leptospira borgpetersenii serovar Hardjo-bovis str. Sponselee]
MLRSIENEVEFKRRSGPLFLGPISLNSSFEYSDHLKISFPES